MIRRHEDVRKGDRFNALGGEVEVLRVGTAGWVDVRVAQPHGATWTKRMPEGIPESWPRRTEESP